MLLIHILWEDRPIFIISASNEQLQQKLEYTLLKPDCHSWWFSKMQSDTLEDRYAMKLCFKVGKNATEMYGMLQTAFGASCMNRASVFEWHKRFKEGMESVRDDERYGRSKEVRTPELIGQRVRVTLMAITAFLSRFPGAAQPGTWGLILFGTGSSFQHLLSDWSDLQLTWTSCRRGYILIWLPPTSCERHNFALNSNPRQSRLYPDISRPDAPVIYTGAFPILTAWPGRRSIYNTVSRAIVEYYPLSRYIYVYIWFASKYFVGIYFCRYLFLSYFCRYLFFKL